jgi:diacylglycerol O-acyltransferase
MGSKQRRKTAAIDHNERMSVVDTAWLRMDGPGNAMVIVSVLTTATPVRAVDLRRVLDGRLLCFERFRQRPVADALGASWHVDAGFDLDAHFVGVSLPQPAGAPELQALAGQLAGERLDPSRPLWQIHFIEHYGAGSAWVLRVHHCYADGMAMLRVLFSLTEQDPDPDLAAARGSRPDTRSRSPGAARGAGLAPVVAWLDQVSRPAGDILERAVAGGARLLEAGVHRLLHPDDAARLAAQAGGMVGEFAKVLALPDDPATPLRGEPCGQKRVAWSAPLDLVDVRTVSRALDCTVNDVLMATVAGALGAHLREACDFDTDELVLRASVPVNLRAAEEPTTLGNKFGLVFVDLPVGIVNPLQRVFRMHDTMRALKGSLQPAMTLMVLGMMGMLPAVAQAPAVELFSRKGTLVASNVPGPQAPLYLCGQRIEEMYFWVPQSGSIGVGVSVLSYAGKVFLGVIADQRCLADPQSVADRFGREFETTLLAATVGLLGLRAKRKSPAVRAKRAAAGSPTAKKRSTAARRSKPPV